MKEDWTHEFSSRILARGREYYEEGLVKDLESDDGTITAVVEGKNEYDVEIGLSGSRIEYMSCTCPYAEDGKNCKHMAAVLYAYENRHDEKEMNRIEEIIESLSEKDLREIVRVCSGEPCVKRMLFEYAMKSRDDDDDAVLENLEFTLETIQDEYADDWNFIPYENAWRWMNDVTEETDRVEKKLEKNGELSKAFRAVLIALRAVEKVDVNDGDGQILYICDMAHDAWHRLIGKATEEEKDLMLALLIDSGIDTDYDTPLTDTAENVLFECFSERKYFDTVYEEARRKLKIIGTAKYREASLLARMLDMITDFEDADALAEKMNYELGGLQSWAGELLEWYMKTERYQKAHGLAVNMRIGEKDEGKLYRLSEKIVVSLYGLKENEEALKELEKMVLRFTYTDSDYLIKLHDEVSAEHWNEILPEIEKKYKGLSNLADLYAATGEYGKIFIMLCDEGTPCPKRILEKYEKALIKADRKRAAEVRVRFLRRDAKGASTRAEYRKLAENAKEVFSLYPENVNISEMLLEHLREDYGNRPALKDEFRKAGFKW